MTQQFIVSVPGRAQPLCIEADSYKYGGFEGDGVTPFKGESQVAIVPAVDLVATADCLPVFPALPQFMPPMICTDDEIDELVELELRRTRRVRLEWLRRCFQVVGLAVAAGILYLSAYVAFFR
ncbi:hypothetical protein [Pseudomonas sp. LAM2023]|uniref:hypothetical protein n=1 Tax=Pseudomonas sp. LAM2023 TaxID=2800477 RepID=UPI00190D40E0|nr:hypothetical protein [Pseudomonas sp. LAM2023]